MPQMTAVVSLNEVTKKDIESAGGKGANLGELIQHGFPVPPGFIITAGVYAGFIKDLNLPEAINVSDCAAIRARILAADIPANIVDGIASHHKQIQLATHTDVIYAVRSSATAEDLGDASFAGQHDTYYYVNEPRLPLMIKQCWASLWSNAAYSYREAQGIEHSAVNMAVIVQEMIQSDISGVTFTADPLTGDAGVVVTESSWGMGAAIVDGRVSPDQYVTDKDSGVVKSKRIADKKFMVPAQVEDNESRLVPVPAMLRRKETLPPRKIETVVHWARRSEVFFGDCQDIEWTFRDDEFFILQSRPITVMGSKQDEVPEGEYVLFKPLAENFTEPLLPLSQDIFIRLFPIMSIIQGRVYLSLKFIRPFLPFKMDSEQVAKLAYLSKDDNFVPKISKSRLVFLGILGYITYLVAGVLYLRTRALPNDFMDSFREVFNQVVADETLDAYSALERLFFKPRFFDPVGNMPIFVNISASRYMLLMGVLTRLLKWWIPDVRNDAASYLTSGTEGILSTEMGKRIWELARQAKKHPQVKQTITNYEPKQALLELRGLQGAETFLSAMDEFLAIHGHRTLKEFEINSIRWEEDPTPVIAMIRNYMHSDANPTEAQEKVNQARYDFINEIKMSLQHKPLERQFSFRWRIVQYLRNQAKYFIRLRENSRFYHIMGFYAVRKKIQQMEAGFIQSRQLKCEDDVYYLQWNEILDLHNSKLQWEDVEERIRERRMEFIRLSKISPPRTFGIHIASTEELEVDHMSGQGASPGTYEGVARVVMDPGIDAELRPGEILVAPYTDPAWTPLFLTASAAVVEVGSYLSHAGTIAREYGMPCVVDAQHCTALIKSGDRILVDGSNGTVTLLQPEHREETVNV